MTVKSNFPEIRPSLNLDFANVKALDPRITFTRTTTATYYDGVTTAKAEENLLLQSEDFTTSWNNVRSTDTANTEVAPDGTTTADSILQASGQTTFGGVNQTVSVTPNDYVISIFAKPNGKNFLVISESLLDGTDNRTWFDLSTGAVGTTDAGHTATIVASTNSYYRCAIKFTANASRSGTVFFYVADTDGSLTVADDGNGLYLWGAQLEQRSAVSAYTPTTTQQITNYIPVLQTAPAGVARFDHNPTTGESLGLLVEEQRTNLLTYSEQFDNASWSKTRSSITANTIVAPDGTLTGDKLVENTDTNTHVVGQSISFTSGTTYTMTVYAKAGERPALILATGSTATSSGAARFNLTTGSATLASGTLASFGMTAVGNGWYRCQIIQAATSTASDSWQIRPDTGSTSSYTGDGYSGIYIWGAQIEAGAFPTSYIPTVAATVTRNADAASMTGTNFSSWFNNAEGTLYAETFGVAQSLSGVGRRIFTVSDNTNNNQVSLRYASVSGTTNASVIVNGTGVFSTTGDVSNTSKAALTYKVNDFAIVRNGGAASTDTSGTIPVVNTAYIGINADGATTGTNVLNGTIKKISFYPSRLSDAQLQALTTV